MDVEWSTACILHLNISDENWIVPYLFLFMLGIAIGHIYYFLEDVFPEQPGGFKLLKTPAIL